MTFIAYIDKNAVKLLKLAMFDKVQQRAILLKFVSSVAEGVEP